MLSADRQSRIGSQDDIASSQPFPHGRRRGREIGWFEEDLPEPSPDKLLALGSRLLGVAAGHHQNRTLDVGRRYRGSLGQRDEGPERPCQTARSDQQDREVQLGGGLDDAGQILVGHGVDDDRVHAVAPGAGQQLGQGGRPALAVEGGPGGGEVRLGQHGGDAAVLGSRQRLAVHQDHAFHGGPPGGGKGRGDNGQGRTFGRPQGPRRRRYLGGHVPTQQRVDLLVGPGPQPPCPLSSRGHPPSGLGRGGVAAVGVDRQDRQLRPGRGPIQGDPGGRSLGEQGGAVPSPGEVIGDDDQVSHRSLAAPGRDGDPLGWRAGPPSVGMDLGRSSKARSAAPSGGAGASVRPTGAFSATSLARSSSSGPRRAACRLARNAAPTGTRSAVTTTDAATSTVAGPAAALYAGLALATMAGTAAAFPAVEAA